MSGRGHRDLLVWQRGMELAEAVYKATAAFPADERYGLVAQMRRAAVSVPSNIAEGRGRGSDAELLRFAAIAYGSLMELETQLELACRLGFVAGEQAAALSTKTAEIGRMLNGLRSSLADDRRLKAGD
jgi:four helix bundle protein